MPEVLGFSIPSAVLGFAAAAITALLAVATWYVVKTLRVRKPAEAAAAAIAHEIVAVPQVAVPQAAATPLAQQRATILDTLHASAVSCEDSLRGLAANSDAMDGDELVHACNGLLTNLRRKRPWLSPSTAEQVDQVATSRDELLALLQPDGSMQNSDSKQRQRVSSSLEELVKRITTLRQRLEFEFRASSGLFHPASKE